MTNRTATRWALRLALQLARHFLSGRSELQPRELSDLGIAPELDPLALQLVDAGLAP